MDRVECTGVNSQAAVLYFNVDSFGIRYQILSNTFLVMIQVHIPHFIGRFMKLPEASRSK